LIGAKPCYLEGISVDFEEKKRRKDYNFLN